MMQIRLTPVVKGLLIGNLALFIIQKTIDQFFDGHVLDWLALIPATFVFEFKFWQLFTYAFLHADVMHLFLNLLMLAFVGCELEAFWGGKKFILYYLTCSTGGGLLYLFLQLFAGGAGLRVPMVGASGAIYGLLMAYGILFAERVMLFMMLFPMKAKHFVWILGGLEFLTMMFSGKSGLSSAAHLGGMVAGFFSLWLEMRLRMMRASQLARKTLKRVTQNHLKLVVNNRDGASSGGSKGSGRDSESGSDPKTWH